MKQLNTRVIIAILIIILILLVIAVRIFLASRNPLTDTSNPPTNREPTPTLVQINAPDEDEPFLEAQTIPSTDNGVNRQSPDVQASEQEIQQLLTALPYQTSFTTQAGIPIDITISRTVTVEHPWYLSVDIYGIDYEVPENSPDYAIMRNAFLEGVNISMTWLNSNNVDTTKMYIEWGGDKAIIQNRVSQWLRP
ncbi:MAG: hypothetical protein ACEQSA_04190 [Weeksellaceae bacterium]